MVVVLPAPFGPKSPRISPFFTEKEILLTAVTAFFLLPIENNDFFPGNTFVRRETVIRLLDDIRVLYA